MTPRPMTTDRDILVDAAREGWESGRISERADVVAYLHREADAAHTAWLEYQADHMWRRYTALSSAAVRIERGDHLG